MQNTEKVLSAHTTLSAAKKVREATPGARVVFRRNRDTRKHYVVVLDSPLGNGDRFAPKWHRWNLED